MLERGKMERGIFEIVDTESLVPSEHLLRKIDAAVNFNKIYDMVEPLYCVDNGRPSVDPVVLFKMVLIQHLYGLSSLRRTAEEVSFNIAYRWFLGYRLQENTPHFSTISYNFRHRFTSETVDQIFNWILMEMVEAGYVAPGVVFVDGTHIKANANIHRKIKQKVPVAAAVPAKPPPATSTSQEKVLAICISIMFMVILFYHRCSLYIRKRLCRA
jgi:transposase